MGEGVVLTLWSPFAFLSEEIKQIDNQSGSKQPIQAD